MHIYDVAMTADANITAAVTTTVWQLITPATRWAKLKQVSFGFRSVTSTDVPGIVELVSQTTAGTSSASLTPAPRNPAMPAALASVNVTFSAEPTLGAVRWSHVLPPQGGNLIWQFPLGDEIIVNASQRLGLRVLFPQGQLVRASFTFEE
jgi:hypothetical protein